MSEPENLVPTPATSAVRNTVGKRNEQILRDPNGPASDAALREYCDKYYHQLLPIAEKVHQEKMQQEKLKEVKARLNFEGCSEKNSKIQEVSQHSESRTLDARDLKRKLRFRRSRSMSGSPERNPSVFSRIRRDRSESPRHRPEGRRDGGVFNSLGGKERVCPLTRKAATTVTIQEERIPLQKSVTMRGHHHVIQKHSPKAKIAGVDTGSQGRRRQSQALKKMSYPNHSYDDLKKAFLANYLQQKKCIKDPVEYHQIKQREGESMEDFVQRFKVESRHVKRAPECMRISEFMHGITNPELINRLHDNISKSVDKMMRVTTTFLRGEVAASDQAWKKTLSAWRQQEAGRKQNLDRRGDFRNQHRSERRRDKFTLLTKSPKEILALDKGKFKAPPPMTTPSGKLSHVIKELKQGSGKDQPKAAKKGEISGKDKPLEILMIQPWQRAPSGSEKPNDSSYRTPHWLQWINHMANETNTVASKNKRCEAFHLYMDEFCGSKIIVSIQWDHRKAKSEEDSSSPVNSLRNAKIPSPGRDTHPPE
ncbi:reverse transcriptase domain-containing protein [Tanacetum coccineum]|uniref:Reverse transcriptase domain-containing protein n=1 Tax=Tanacetum coccineum TaxID=301880 RepID=A0ABQ5DF88_9ASTR